MTPEISEFSYGFALTNELVGWTELNAAPIFPSHIEEGKKGGGYDVKLDLPATPLFLQFKRADCMMRSSAKEISKHKLDLDVPFYRFAITERKLSFQHTSLVTLDVGHNSVFYVAPRFHTLAEINSAWTAQKVLQRSIFVAPQQIGLIKDDDRHHVSFDAKRAYFCSQPREIVHVSIEGLRHKLVDRLDQDERPLRTQLAEWRENISRAGERAQFTQVEPDHLLIEEEPSPVVDLRPARPLGPEEAALRDLSDETRRTFNAQLIVVQRGKGRGAGGSSTSTI